MIQNAGDVIKGNDDVIFSNGRHSPLVEVVPGTIAREIITALGPTFKPPTLEGVFLILNGTDIPNPELQIRLVQLFSRGVARAVVENDILIIDGGIESEATAALGKALLDRNSKTPLLGVVNDSKVTYDANDASGRKLLECNHTHFVTISSVNADSEIDKMYEIAEELSQDFPLLKYLTVLVNGDSNAKNGVLRSVRKEWPILVIQGSGGFADEIQHAWQAKQNYIKTLAERKPTDPAETKPTPPFIADPILDEIIAEGNLHFSPITDTPENLKQSVELRLRVNSILNQAQMQQKIYSLDANQQQKIFRLQQNWILSLGVIVTALAAFQSFYKQMQWNVLIPFGSWKINLGDILYYVLISIPVVLTLLIAGFNRFNAGNNWITMRAASQVFKREIFRYRTRTGVYNDIQVAQNNTTREATLAKMLEAITRQWMDGNLDYVLYTEAHKSSLFQRLRNKFRLPRIQRTKIVSATEVSKQVKLKDSGLAYLPPDRYITSRLVDQLNFYKKNCVKLGQRLVRLQWFILILGGSATLLAALHAELAITVTTALAIALSSYLEYNQVANTLKQYNHAILSLTNIQNWWVALEDAQTDPANIDKLVDYVETTLQSEQVGWVQQMQSALTELRAQQAKHGEDPSTLESINKSQQAQSNANITQPTQSNANNAENSKAVANKMDNLSTAESQIGNSLLPPENGT